jgi:hypothetical protein
MTGDMMRRWPWWLLVVAGVVMIAVWPIYISLHGPTSYNEDGDFLGGDPLFWGAMLEGPPNLLIVAGFLALLPGIWAALGRLARVGYVLLLASLAIPAVVDLATLSIMPPLLLPAQVAGLALLAIGGGSLRRITRLAFGVMAILLAAALLLELVLTSAQFDALEGYRIYGLMAHIAVGIGWVVVGVAEGLRRGRVSTT